MDADGNGKTGPSRTPLPGPDLSRFAQIVRSLQVGVYVWRRRDPELRESYELIFANPASETHTGRRPDDVLGRAIYEAFPQWREGPLLRLFDEALERDGGGQLSEIRLNESDGTTSSYSLKVFPLGDEDRSVVLSFENTTERASERAKSERLEHQLLHAQKMEMVGRAAGGIAHDFNNLLTAVLGHSELVMETLDPEHPGRPWLQRVQEAGKRAAELTRRLLAISRHQFSDPELLDLGQVVRENLPLMRSMIGEDVRLRVDLFEGPPLQLIADQAQLGQVILNLVVNAKDAMPAGGELRLTTRPIDVPESQATEAREARAGSYAVLDVEDTGSGMSDEVMARIFEPFFTTKSAEKGTGLGLPTVASIVSDAGGSVEVDSRPGRGSRFTVLLPRVTAEPTTPLDRTAESHATTPGTGATVLVAEDEGMIRALIADLLSAHGYEVIEAADAESALERARAWDGEIHLLISDVVMPQMSGIELARRIWESRPGLPVLLVSGYDEEALERAGGVPDQVEVLLKPFSPSDLLERVAERLAGHPDPTQTP